MYAFGPFRLDVEGQRLWRGDDVVPLQAKAFELLAFLVARPDELVPREALQEALWPDVVVTDQSLRQAVRRVREALGDDEGTPAYVETVPRRGYRFVAAVRVAGDEPELVPEPGKPPAADDLARIGALFRRPGVRVVTLNGPAGAGKTRLARRFADEHPGPVWFVTNAEVPAEATEGLVVLDGVDAALDTLEARVAAALARAPGVRFLITCRDGGLGLVGEEALDVDLAAWRPSPGGLVPGTPFVLERRLGEGAVGEAWLARHEKLRDTRVFKFSFDRERVRSLRREVALFRVLAQRVGAHPHIVRLHDVRLDAPPWYLVTDYAEGKDLVGWFADGPPPMEARLEVVAQVAEALQAAHEAGVIHRDVKPSNVLVAGAGGRVHARLADFGVGQVLSEDLLTGLTRQGLPATMVVGTGSGDVGTRMYFAPEVVAGKAATPRSDLFSLGVVLWQLVVGDLRRALPPDWAAEVADPLLREDLAAALAGDPERRLSAPLELARRLRDLPARRAAAEAEERARQARERAAYRRGVRRTAVLASIGVAAFCALAVLAWQGRAESQALAEANRLALYTSLVATGRSRLESGDRLGALPYFAEALAHARGPSVAIAQQRLAETFAAGPRLVGVVETNDAGADVALSPDGRKLVTVDRTGIGADAAMDRGMARLWDVANGTLLGQHDIGTRSWVAAFSPAGDAVLVISESKRVEGTFETRSTEARVFDPATFALVGGPWRDDAPILCNRRNGGFTDGGRAVWTGDSCGSAIHLWDRKTGAPLPTPTVPEGVACAISEDGRVVLACGPDAAAGKGRLLAVDRADGRVLRVLPAFEPGLPMSLDAAGMRVAYVLGGGGGLVASTRTESPPRLFTHGAIVYRPRLSRDGHTLVTASRDGTARVWGATSGEEIAPPLWIREQVQGAAVSDDGRLVAATGFDKLARVWALGARARPDAVPASDVPVNLSPDGTRVLVRTDDGWLRYRDRETGAATGPGIRDPQRTGLPPTVLVPLDHGRLLFRGGTDDVSFDLADLDAGRVLARFPCTEASGCGVVPTYPGGPVLATVEGGLRAFDPMTGEPHGPVVPTGPGISFVTRREGTTVLVLSADASRVWDVATGKPVSAVLPRLGRFAYGDGWVAGAPTDAMVVERVDSDAVVYALDGTVLARLPHPGGLVSMAASPDGRLLATASVAGDLYVWDPRTGERRLGPVLAGMRGPIGWTGDGRYIVDASAFGPATLVDAATGEFVAQASPSDWPPLSALLNGTYRFEPARRDYSLDDWREIATLLASRTADADGARRLPAERVVALWKDLAARHPEDFTPARTDDSQADNGLVTPR